MADGFGLRQQLDARIAAARRSLFWPALIRSTGPVALWIAAFLIFWLSGVSGSLPPEGQAIQGVVFWSGALLLGWYAFAAFRKPTDEDARRLIDSRIEGRPLSAWADRPASADSATWSLWSAHRDRMAALAAKMGRINLAPEWRAADPLWLRVVAPVLVIIAAIVAGPQLLDRARNGAAPDIGALFGAHKLTVEAWITPPAYTGSAPFVLTDGQTARAHQGSEVTLRVIGPGRPAIRINNEDGADATLKPRPGIDDAYESVIEVDRPMTIVVDFWGARASFPFTIIPDGAPAAEFISEPKLGDGDRTEFQWKVSDDYGVVTVDLVARLAEPPAGAEELEEVVAVDLMGFDPKEEEGEYSQDLVRHRWAGLPVMVKLRATDAAGQTGESTEFAYTFPEKIFLQPLARSAQEIRAEVLREWRPYADAPPEENYTAVNGEEFDAFADASASRLKRAPEGVQDAAMMLEALTYAPGEYFLDPIIFMGFRSAWAIIDSAKTKEEAEHSEFLLWTIALRAEYGSLADAKAALDAARRALEEALRRGASEEEIRRLMDMFEQAVENYLAAQMAEALRNGNVTQGDGQPQAGGGMSMGDDELQRMLDALRDLTETGASDQARQLLSDMARLLEQFENMQLQMSQGGGGQQQDGPMSRALNRALQDTNRALSDQRDLNDQTDQAQREGGGDPRRQQELADQQRSLRERLEQQMRSGGGQPGQQGQDGQGQQGQQGQGQQPGQQGQNGQGQQPGQGQQGQQGQGQQPGQNADRGGGPGGQPGVDADGRFGQENARSRQLLGNAIEMQRRAEEALRRGDFDAARRFQQDAMSALQSRSSELARLADEADPDARADRDQRDILGRLNNGDSGYGDNVQVPDEMERQRARDILDEIRRRLGNRTLRPDEMEYLRRLLDRF